MPRIAAATVVANRELRRHQIVAAASELALEGDGRTLTMSAIAQKAGLSRTALYEYFGSTSDVVAELILDELLLWAKKLETAVSEGSDGEDQVRSWISTALSFISDGRHQLVKALSLVTLPADRNQEIAMAHRKLVAPLVETLRSMGVPNPHAAALLVNSAVESATKRIEAGADSDEEVRNTITFVIAGIRGLAQLRHS